MIILNTKSDSGVLTATLRIEPPEFSKALSEAYLDRTDEYVVPGYAAGLAPREAIEETYGPTALFDEALDLLIPELFGNYLHEQGLRIIGKPEVTEVTWLDNGGAEFTVQAILYPKTELGEYKGIRVLVPDKTDDAVIGQEVLKIACENMKADITDAIIEHKLDTMAASEKLNVFGDAIYHVLADSIEILAQAYRGAGISRPMAQIRAEALDLMLMTVSGDNDQPSKEFFARQVRELVQQYRDVPDDFDTELDGVIETRHKKKAGMTTVEQADEVFSAYLGSLGLNENGWRSERKEQAIANVRADLLLDAVAKEEKIGITDEDLYLAISKIADQSGLEVNEVRGEVDIEPIKWQILRDKALKLIIDSCVRD